MKEFKFVRIDDTGHFATKEWVAHQNPDGVNLGHFRRDHINTLALEGWSLVSVHFPQSRDEGLVVFERERLT